MTKVEMKLPFRRARIQKNLVDFLGANPDCAEAETARVSLWPTTESKTGGYKPELAIQIDHMGKFERSERIAETAERLCANASVGRYDSIQVEFLRASAGATNAPAS